MEEKTLKTFCLLNLPFNDFLEETYFQTENFGFLTLFLFTFNSLDIALSNELIYVANTYNDNI